MFSRGLVAARSERTIPLPSGFDLVLSVRLTPLPPPGASRGEDGDSMNKVAQITWAPQSGVGWSHDLEVGGPNIPADSLYQESQTILTLLQS